MARSSADDPLAHLMMQFVEERKPEVALCQLSQRSCLPRIGNPLHETRRERNSDLAGIGDDVLTYSKPEEPVLT